MSITAAHRCPCSSGSTPGGSERLRSRTRWPRFASRRAIGSLYLEETHPAVALARLARWLGASDADRHSLEAGATIRLGGEAGRHLLRVASGLESAVLGEDQILGQVRSAYREACSAGSAGPLLHRLFHAAFRAGKRVRSETPLGQGGRSLAGAAVGQIAREVGGLADAAALVLGTGEMASRFS